MELEIRASGTPAELLASDAEAPWVDLAAHPIWAAALAGSLPRRRLADLILAIYPAVAGAGRYVFAAKVSQIAQAALNHHSDLQMDGGNKLSAILTVADYLCSKCGLGFFTEPASPAAEALAMCQCADDGSMSQVIEEIQEAYQAESELFKPA